MLNNDERRVNKWLSEFPQDLNFAIATEKYKAPSEATWKPEKDNLVEAQSRKRKASESLDSVNQVFSELEGVLKKVLEEGKVIEERVKRPLADELLFGRLKDGGAVTVDALGEEFSFGAG